MILGISDSRGLDLLKLDMEFPLLGLVDVDCSSGDTLSRLRWKISSVEAVLSTYVCARKGEAGKVKAVEQDKASSKKFLTQFKAEAEPVFENLQQGSELKSTT